MEPLLILAVAVVAAVGGAVVGMLLRSLWASQTMKAATAEGAPDRGRGARPARRN